MDTEQNIAERVVKAFGGLTKASEATGWPISTIQHWTRSGTIPEWRREGILDAAHRASVELPAEFTNQKAA